MIVEEINNVVTAKTDYFSVDVLETVALVPKTLFAHCDRYDLNDINSGDSVKEIKVNGTRYVIKSIVEENDYFIFQMDEVV